MFNDKKYNAIAILKQLNILSESFTSYKKCQDKKFEELNSYYESKFFKLKYPNGSIMMFSENYIYCNIENKNVIYRYVSKREIKEIRLINLYEVLDGYKICKYNNIIYIGIKSGNKERYFVVDRNKGLAIEIENKGLEAMDDLEWINN